MELILAAAITLSPWNHIEMSRYMKCPESQGIIARIYKSEALSDSQKMDLIEVIMENTEVNCKLPQAV